MQLAKLISPREVLSRTPQIQSILCPVDFSEFSLYAYEYAQSLAWHYNATLFLQYILYSPRPPEGWSEASEESCQEDCADVERQLQEFANRYKTTEVRPQCFVQESSQAGSVNGTANLIISLAKEQAVDLIVMGTHGLRGMDLLIMGSVTEKVLRRARCPVLAVRRPAHHLVSAVRDPAPVHLRKMLFCSDLSAFSRHAMEYAFTMAEEYGAELTLLHVLEETPKSEDLESATEEAVKQMEESIAPEVRDECPVKVIVRLGKPYQEITQFALEAQIDLVIMGVRGHGSLHTALFGPTTYRVIQLGSAPVLALHT